MSLSATLNNKTNRWLLPILIFCPSFLLAVFLSSTENVFGIGKNKSLNLKNKTNKILGGNRFETRATHSEK
jgi:hypothetical protein